MLYDCFLLNDELEVLEIRLNELYAIVDKFVIVEATVTHTNKPKPLYFEKNKKRFKKFSDKIIHIVVKDSPDVSMPWIIERHQLTSVMRGLKNCKPEDTVLYSCVDEIPKAEKLIKYLNRAGSNKVFMHKMCLYFLNYAEIGKSTWQGVRMFKYKYLKKAKDIYITRYLNPDVVIEEGGWHFSYQGGVKRIQRKLSSFAHQEFNNNKYNTPEKILKSIKQGKDFLDLGYSLKIEDIDFLPSYVVKNRKKFNNLIISANENNRILFFDSLYLTIKENLRVNIRGLRKRLS